jgi:hypothetical protein
MHPTPQESLTWDLLCGLLPCLVGAAPALGQKGWRTTVDDKRESLMSVCVKGALRPLTPIACFCIDYLPHPTRQNGHASSRGPHDTSSTVCSRPPTLQVCCGGFHSP